MKTDDGSAELPHGLKIPILFWLLTALMILLCFEGGRFGNIGESALTIPSIHPNDPLVVIPAGQFIVLFCLSWITCIGLMITWPKRLPSNMNLWLLLVLALTVRLLLLPHEPSDDINRYLWEGRLVNAGISPYAYAPDAPQLAHLAGDDPYHAQVNHPDNPAAYPPMILLMFAVIARFSYSSMAIKLVLLGFDLGTLMVLLALLRRRGMSCQWSVLYAFNPVILYSFAGQGHFDAAQNFFLMAALYCYDIKHWSTMFIAAGLAVQGKFTALVGLPFLVRRDNLKYAWLCLLTILAPYVPFLLADSRQLFYSVIKFGEQYAFNGSIHGFLRLSMGGIQPATHIVKHVFAGLLLWGWYFFHPHRKGRYRDDPLPGVFFALGALLLLSPTIHFWYISWVVPLLVLRPALSWSVLCLTVSAYFITNGINYHTGRWYLPPFWQVFEWLPVYGFLAYEAYLWWHRIHAPTDSRAPQNVSLVIPVINEAEEIVNCVQCAQTDSALKEIIVVDGGSTDQTVTLADQAGARVIKHALSPHEGGGRGGQIMAGINAAQGDIIAILHADVAVAYPAFSRMVRVLQHQPDLIGGALGGFFSKQGWRYRVLEMANDLRTVATAISFGDQVQFFRRRPVVQTEAFPAIPLMEDVELSLQLRRLGCLTYLFGDAAISPRRWQRRGKSNFMLILRLFFGYLWQRFWHHEVDTSAMYRRYYNS